MIEKIFIDGFRTLNKFHLALRPGLNVLVGPNGAGKTNILYALDFLTALATDSLERAVTRRGGISALATWPAKGRGRRPITLEVQGAFDVKQYVGGPHAHPDFGHNGRIGYAYRVKIHISRNGDFGLDDEKIAIFTVPPAGDPKEILGLSRKKGRLKVEAFDSKQLSAFGGPESRKEFLLATKNLEHYVDRDKPLISSVEHASFLVHLLKHELEHSERSNIVPNVAKESNHIGTAAYVQPSGSGLVRTLAALQEGTSSRSPNPKRAYERIVQRLRLAVPSVRELKFHLDEDSGRYVGMASVGAEGETQRQIPIGRLSDGTLKWLAFLTQLETSNLYSVEEPENYLHPAMQRQAIEYLRMYSNSKKWASPVLITTHSESVINSLNPEELVVIRDVDGRSEASRLKDPKLISKSLNQSGFGLAYIYMSGTLDEPSQLRSAGKLS